MYLGIDLGTSNSAIAGYEGGAIKLFKSIEGHDVLPSVIMMDRRGNLLVGRRAYEQSAYSPENVAQGFKRLMGTSTPLRFLSCLKEMSAEQASAEVLKCLMAQAQMAVGQLHIEGTVVTIPAAFNQMQSEATMRAAAIAGIRQVALLQEPIAAAMASIANSKNKDGQFLVYDLGGGTFDAAIVQSISGTATIIAHAGINMLGGRDFDRAIVNSVIRPWLLSTFDLPDNFQTLPEYQRLIRLAQYRAESTKIALSTQTTDRIFADETQVCAKDRTGVDVFLDVEISRSLLEELIKEDVDRSIELCRKLLSDNNYAHDDIDRVVLIGGPSRMPVVRQQVAGELGIRVDLDLDPMTAVAFGAAIFAEGREWKATDGIQNKPRKSGKQSASLPLDFDFPLRTADIRARIKIRVIAALGDRGMRVQADTEDGWTSGQMPLAQVTEIREIPLNRLGKNYIRISFFDVNGSRIDDVQKDIEIVRVGAASDGMPITHNLAVKISSGSVGLEQNTLATLVSKGAPVPRSGIEHYRSALDLRAGDGRYLAFELYEQADGVLEPGLNLPIGEFRLKSEELLRGDVVRRGDDVFVHWEIDSNGLLNCQLEFPTLAKTFSTGKMYVSTAGHKNFDGDDGRKLAVSMLSLVENDISRLEQALGSRVASEVVTLRKRQERQIENLKLSFDSETRRGISEEARLIRQEVHRISNSPENLRACLRGDIDSLAESISVELADLIESKKVSQMHKLIGMARDSLVRDGGQAVDESRASLNEVRMIVITELAKRPDFWIARFEAVAANRHLAADKTAHDRMVAEGERCITRQDIDQLRQLTIDLGENQVQLGGSTHSDVIAGLMRA